MNKSNNSNLLKGVLQPLIIKLLKENGRMYGYEITLKVKEITRGKMILTEGSLYPALQRLESDNILTAEVEYYGNRPRKYYSLKLKNKKEINYKLDEVYEFIQMMLVIFKPQVL